MQTTQTKKITRYISVILALIVAIAGLCSAVMHVKAEEPPTGVIAELAVDETFDVEDYPKREDDYSLDVIQLAEATDRTVVLYVYQPSGDKFKATTVNISAGIKSDKPVYNYALEHIATEGTVSKYAVAGLSVSDELIRTYDIVSIFRQWDKTIDKDAGNDNHVSEVAYPVGQCWSAYTADGRTLYNCTESETVTITDKFVGMIQYRDGINWNALEYTHSHFVAFKTDRDIDRLYEADVLYNTQVATVKVINQEVTYSDKVQHYDTIKYDEIVQNGGNWGSKKYKFNRIQTVDEFLATEELTDEPSRNRIAGMDYVLRICETPYDHNALGGKWSALDIISSLPHLIYLVNAETELTVVSDVSVLRLMFETDGVQYNVGVVDNKQMGSGAALNIKGIEDIPYWVWLIVAAVVLILIVTLCPPILNVVVALIKGVFNVIALPFKLIAQAAKKSKKNGK